MITADGTPSSTTPASTLARHLLLALALLLIQFGALSHPLQHLDDEPATPPHDCVLCLALAGIGGALPASATPAASALATTALLCQAVPPAPTFAPRLAFRSRAPPSL